MQLLFAKLGTRPPRGSTPPSGCRARAATSILLPVKQHALTLAFGYDYVP
jgi:hypothetical protein